ncbi:hypothetical protein QZH41_001125 [Actinostola sp. cb2023]|nr:hypothetical protein QZH41_001125 [Actinostola sp. cb2023]
MVDIQQEDSSNKFTYNPFKGGSSELVFEPNKELSQQVNAGLGKVRLCCKSDPMLSTIQVDGHLEALKKAKLTVETKTSAGELNNEPSDDVDVQIRPEDDVKVEERKMRSCGKIEVEFIPQVAGQLTAQVQVNGNAVSNSPLVMDVKPQHMDGISGDSKLKSALNTGSRNFSGIAVNKTNSRIAVADWNSNCVRVFNMDGDLLLTYGRKGSGQGQLYCPAELAFLNETDLVIADCGNHKICIVNTITGTLVKTFGCHGNGNGQSSHPRGVHVDDDCNIVVSDRDNHRVQVFTKNGEYKYQFSLSNQGGFSPWCTVTHNGLFYVSDASNKVIHVIEMKDNSPTRISTIGGNCHTAGQLQGPMGLAIDNNHNLLDNGSSVPFDDFIVLLMCLIDRNSRELTIAFLDERGLRNPNCMVRSRCCYLLSRFIKAHKNHMHNYVDDVLKRLQTLLITSADNGYQHLSADEQWWWGSDNDDDDDDKDDDDANHHDVA